MNLREYRNSKSLTLMAVAADLGVSFQTVSKWETGRRHPTGQMLADIMYWSKGKVDISTLVPEGQRWEAKKTASGGWKVTQTF